MPNGLSQKSMVERMYTAMVGIDGNGGMVQDITEAKESRGKIHDRIDSIEKNMVSKVKCEAIRKGKAGQKRDRWLAVKSILLIVFGSTGGAGTVMIILKIWGKL